MQCNLRHLSITYRTDVINIQVYTSTLFVLKYIDICIYKNKYFSFLTPCQKGHLLCNL